MNTPDPIETEIAARLAATVPEDSPNEISADELREWAVEYLEDCDEAFSDTPDEMAEPHFELSMLDERPEDALFTVLLFGHSGIDFVCGIGHSKAIREFIEEDRPQEPDLILAEMIRRFSVPTGRLMITREDGERWLGRSWLPAAL